MKKYGKRYRKLQKEKELSKGKNPEIRKSVSEEVNDMNTALLSMSQIAGYNPIGHDAPDRKKEYLTRLNSYVRAVGRNRRKYEKAQLCAYEKILFGTEEIRETHHIDFYRYYMLLDVLHVTGYQLMDSREAGLSAFWDKYYLDFPGEEEHKLLAGRVVRSVQEGGGQLRLLKRKRELSQEREYIELIRKNISFQKEKPFGMMVTATMSAGKSTFINALAGKYICRARNLACTGKIHCIVNKAFEDNLTYEYDHDLVMTAGHEELMNENGKNRSGKIVVSTYFHGELEKQRMILNDSPGVNFSGNKKHKEITDKLIKGKDYHLLIYILNATQMSTDDEERHLEFVRQAAGRHPVLFVLNKVDAVNPEEENLETIIARQKEYLKEKGFENPAICPVSAKAGYLSKKFASDGLSRTEEKELYSYVDKFERMGLAGYYAKNFRNIKVRDTVIEERQLWKTSGMAYTEKIIKGIATGGKRNGSDIY